MANSNETESDSSPAEDRHRRRTRLIVSAAIVAALVFAIVQFDVLDHLRSFVTAVDSLGFWGPLIFIVVYVLATVFLIPGSVLTLGAGAAFGLAKGFILVSIGSTLGAAAAYLVGRYLARDWVARKVEGNARIAAIDKAIAREGWKIVGLIRLTPLLPYTLLNYALSVTSVRFVPYVFASWAGMIPGTIMYVYLGSLGNTAAEGTRTPAQWALLTLGLVATVAVTLIITKAAKHALDELVSET